MKFALRWTMLSVVAVSLSERRNGNVSEIMTECNLYRTIHSIEMKR
jgi:hypothetical protein